jgi:superoxide dismutase, Cu-Zn family
MSAVAYFPGPNVIGEVVIRDVPQGCRIKATFSKLPAGLHGFHIHNAGDLRGEGCQGACEHFHKGPPALHGGPPTQKGQRHTGDLGNIEGPCEKTYTLLGVSTDELFGRSVIVHEDEDDLGKGPFEDSTETGHAGKRMACAIIGRIKSPSCQKTTRKTLKNKHKQ